MSDNVEQATPTQQVCQFLEELAQSKQRYAQTSVRDRISLAEACAEGLEALHVEPAVFLLVGEDGQQVPHATQYGPAAIPDDSFGRHPAG